MNKFIKIMSSSIKHTHTHTIFWAISVSSHPINAIFQKTIQKLIQSKKGLTPNMKNNQNTKNNTQKYMGKNEN